MAKADIRVDVLGTSFSLSVDEEPLYLQTILGRYRTVIDNTQKITGLTDPLKIAILAGIQLCDDLEKLRVRGFSGMGGGAEAKTVEDTLISLIKRIDEAIPV